MHIDRDLLNQRWCMLTNKHTRAMDNVSLFMADLAAHKKDLHALDWSDIGRPLSNRQLIEQCWARFYRDFFLN